MDIRDCEVLFNTTPRDELQAGWQSGVLRQRAKRTKAGEMLYVDSYPIWDTAASHVAKKHLVELKRQGTTGAQRRLNIRNAEKKLVQKINTNFGEDDLLCTYTYHPDSQPKDEKEAVKNIRNFNRRVRRLYKHKGLLNPRYIYVTEVTHSTKYGKRYHHHLIMSGKGLVREEVEELWSKTHNGFCNTRRYQAQEKRLTGFAKYMLKGIRTDKRNGQQLASKRSWNCSKNLVEPEVSQADNKISLRRVNQIALSIENQETAKGIFEKLYPRYHFISIDVRTSTFVAGAYIYVTMCERSCQREVFAA